jgi:murein DD-endopeptidase MepM/ murein hydrolase activator NlpD
VGAAAEVTPTVRLLGLSLATLATALILLVSPAGADGGGAAAPTLEGGGVVDGPQAPTGKRRRRGPLLTAFLLKRPRLFLYGRPSRVTFRIEARAKSVRTRLDLLRPGQRAPVKTILLGERPTGVTQSYLLTGRENGILRQGRYVLRIGARDRRGRRLRRAPRLSSATELRFFHHRFPLVGLFAYGGEGSRFGAPRSGHIHQGQDLSAAEGTPIVAPRGGVVETVAYQAGGAGHYVVLDGERQDRDYVFMHLRSGSVRVSRGQRVRTGQRIGDVGTTGSSSGAHLHFEVWVGGWFAGGHPIDPLPLLRAWDRWS